MWNRQGKSLHLFPKKTDWCSPFTQVIMIFLQYYSFLVLLMIFTTLSFKWTPFGLFVFTSFSLCGCKNKHIHFQQIRPVLLLLKDGKDAIHEQKTGWKVFITRLSLHFSAVNNIMKVLFPFCTLTWHADNDVSGQGKSLNRRTESSTFFRSLYKTLVLLE